MRVAPAIAAALLVACASPEPRAIPVDAARVRAFEACPRPHDKRDAGFRRLLAARLAAHGGEILALAEELRTHACVASVFVSPPVENLRELHLTYRDGPDAAWVVDVIYPEPASAGDDASPQIGDLTKKRPPGDDTRGM